MPAEHRSHPKYDVPTAVTFLLGGVALGSILTLLFSSLRFSSLRSDEIRSQKIAMRPAEAHQQKFSVAASGTPQNTAKN
jgi:hypothetical protein